ncbi:MAG: hypothetical protein ABFS14_11150 [Gemmatimonadota bacterium]
MANCREVARSLASDEAGDAGRRRSLATWFHLVWCRHCRRYASQLELLGQASRQAMQPQSEDLELKERLEKALLDAADDPPSPGL